MKKSPSLEEELQEVITKHTEQQCSDSALEGFPFQVIIAADENENVKMTVRWPDDAPPAVSTRIISSILHHVTSGHWKPPMINAVRTHGMESQSPDVAGQILLQWGSQTQEVVKDEICVSPRHVFLRQGANNGIANG